VSGFEELKYNWKHNTMAPTFMTTTIAETSAAFNYNIKICSVIAIVATI